MVRFFFVLPFRLHAYLKVVASIPVFEPASPSLLHLMDVLRVEPFSGEKFLLLECLLLLALFLG